MMFAWYAHSSYLILSIANLNSRPGGGAGMSSQHLVDGVQENQKFKTVRDGLVSARAEPPVASSWCWRVQRGSW